MTVAKDIYWVPDGQTPARYSLFWHYKRGGVDCRIYSSESWENVYAKWLTDAQYGLVCNLS